MVRPPFHLAIPVRDLGEARRFYKEILGCAEGRSSDRWVDFDFRGHQVVAHLSPAVIGTVPGNEVDGDAVPARHFGLVLDPAAFDRMQERLEAAGVDFLIEPHLRFKGLPGEQRTMFVLDPSGNALEFKSFSDPGRLFKRE